MSQESTDHAMPPETHRLSPDEERVLIVLAQSAHSVTLKGITDRLETAPTDLRDALRSLYRRRFLVISRGVGPSEDTYLLSRTARTYTRCHLLADLPHGLPIESLGSQDTRGMGSNRRRLRREGAHGSAKGSR